MIQINLISLVSQISLIVLTNLIAIRMLHLLLLKVPRFFNNKNIKQKIKEVKTRPHKIPTKICINLKRIKNKLTHIMPSHCPQTHNLQQNPNPPIKSILHQKSWILRRKTTRSQLNTKEALLPIINQTSMEDPTRFLQ